MLRVFLLSNSCAFVCCDNGHLRMRIGVLTPFELLAHAHGFPADWSAFLNCDIILTTNLHTCITHWYISEWNVIVDTYIMFISFIWSFANKFRENLILTATFAVWLANFYFKHENKFLIVFVWVVCPLFLCQSNDIMCKCDRAKKSKYQTIRWRRDSETIACAYAIVLFIEIIPQTE